jgi:predicted acyltransferase
METLAPQQPAGPRGQRLVSLDALRGFDMFWIVGGDGLFRAIYSVTTGHELPAWLNRQFEHAEWNGFHFEDLIFPLFVFLAGVSLPFSIGKRVERREPKARIYARIARRVVLLIVLGLIYNKGGLLCFQFAGMRYPSVLGRIGLAYGVAALIMLHCSFRGRFAWLAVLLLGYWAAMTWIPVPQYGAGNLAAGKNLSDYLDLKLLPGKTYRGDGDPEGLLSTLPVIGTALLGVMAGQWLKSSRHGHEKAGVLLAAAAAALALGGLWSLAFPINKNLWTSSFVLWSGGWSLMLLGLFYLVIDVWGLKGWAFPLVVIGVNPITIYLAVRFIDFGWIAENVFRHAPIHPVLLHECGLLLAWLLLYAMYRNKIFMRV